MNYGLIAVILMIVFIGYFFISYERKNKNVKEIALMATIAGLAGVLRLPFAALPNIQPTTFIVIMSGYIFGPTAGFVVGAIATLVSNSFLGHGPWTPWQMVAWGLAGCSAGWISSLKLFDKRIPMAIFAFIWGFLFDYIMNLWHWLFFVYPLNLKTFIATYIASFYFDLMHATGNFIFVYFFGNDLMKLFKRFKDRLSYKKLEGVD